MSDDPRTDEECLAPPKRPMLVVAGMRDYRAFTYIPRRFFSHYELCPDGLVCFEPDFGEIRAAGFDALVFVTDCQRVTISVRAWQGDHAFLESHPLGP